MSVAKTYTNDELQIYTNIVLRYYNYYLSSNNTNNSLSDTTIRDFSQWYEKFIFDGDFRTMVKEFNEQTIKENETEEHL